MRLSQEREVDPKNWTTGEARVWPIREDGVKAAIEAVRERKTVSELAIQFTSEAFTGRLEAVGIAISMDGRTRALENMFIERLWRSVKCEDIYLKGYATADGLTEGLRVATFRHDASSLLGLHPDRLGECLLRKCHSGLSGFRQESKLDLQCGHAIKVKLCLKAAGIGLHRPVLATVLNR